MFHNIAIRSGSDNGRGDFAETLREVDWIVGLLVDDGRKMRVQASILKQPGRRRQAEQIGQTIDRLDRNWVRLLRGLAEQLIKIEGGDHATR